MLKEKSNKHVPPGVGDLGKRFSDATIHMHEAIAKRAGLPITDHKYLRFILEQEALTPGKLSKLTGLTTGAVTGLIDRLEKKKLVKRVNDKNDRRKVLIKPLEENVTKVFGNVFAQLQISIAQLFATLTTRDQKVIENYLLSTIGIMQGITEKLQPKKNLSKNKKIK